MVLRRLKSWSTVSFAKPVTNTLFAFSSALRSSSKSFFLSSLFFISDSGLRLRRDFLSRQFRHIDRYAGAHRRAQRGALHVFALRHRRFGFQHGGNQARSILDQLDRRETDFADWGV